jgi:hypothetical protein
MYPNAAVAYDVRATLATNPCPVSGNKENQVWNSVIHIVVAKGWFPTKSKYVRLLNYGDSLIRLLGSDARSSASTRAGFFDVHRSMTLIVSTKITWWLRNHHVGQIPSELASYVGKVAFSMGFTGNVSAIRTVLWVAGKWTSTISILHALKIPGIANAGDDKANKGSHRNSQSPTLLDL